MTFTFELGCEGWKTRPCTVCGEERLHGGVWHGLAMGDIAVCTECVTVENGTGVQALAAVLADALCDTDTGSTSMERVNRVLNEFTRHFWRALALHSLK